MNGPTHALAGLAFSLTVVHFTQPDPLAGLVGVSTAVLAALAPDRIQYSVPGGRFPLEGHRGVSHTLLFAAITSLAFRPEIAIYWALGILSHDLLDIITVAGIPFLWPIVPNRISLHLTKNGGMFERGLAGLLAGISFGWLVQSVLWRLS